MQELTNKISNTIQGASMLWMAVLGTAIMWFSIPSTHSSRRGAAYQIQPKPCWVDGIEGTCMFVYECIKSEGVHIGMCVDTFMFGSCCAHNASVNAISIDRNKPAVLYTSSSQPKLTTKTPMVTAKPSTLYTGISVQKHSSSINRTLQMGMSLRPHSSSKKPTMPPRNSLEQVNEENLDKADSNNQYSYTKLGWRSTTEPGFITSVQHNSISTEPSPGLHWPQTTEPSYVRTKFKPNMNKMKPTKKPIYNKVTNKYGFKPTKGTTTTKRPISVSTKSPVTSTIWKTEKVPTSTDSSNPVTVGVHKKIGCGVSKMTSQPHSRIVGGKNAPFGRWPWQVSVRRTSFFGFSSTHRCGGAILNENWIATAGHCVDDLLTSQIRIRVGEYDFSSVQEELPYVERAVTKKVVHPKYNIFTYEYDLALVQLEAPLEFLPHIAPICLPASDDLLIGENATVTGWGRLSEGGTLPSVLQEVQVPIVSNDRCKSMFLRAGRHEFIPDIFLCAGHEKGGQDSCQGDSGGPLQVKGKDGRYFLAGIISWGIGCAEANLPGVCTRISKFVPWILKNVT
ncbi:serine proteinase stubble [Coccinella septempunctata]|uniref:serine proteinase stubble n=1 Tax=Coccinella septempunctata TaxID=41139 RepID=UPI001D079F31|nr:serine proteinase stubble [Coccinella septempunctata]